MSVRRALPYLLALLIGTSTGLLAACGGSTKGGIPSASAGDLKSQITDVAQAVEGGRCDEVEGQLGQVDDGIDELPETTDAQLVSALRDGADRLREQAVDECDPDSGTQTTTTETTPTETTTTETLPEEEPTDTLPTETDPTPTTTTPSPTPPPTGGAPPVDPPAPPPVTPPVTPPPPPPPPPGGGVVPEIPPDD